MNKFKELQNGSDIRGVALAGIEGEEVNLDKQKAKAIGAGFAKWLQAKREKAKVQAKNTSPEGEIKILIGYDSRLSAQAMQSGFASGVLSQGLKIASTGLASTPALFMACIQANFEAGVMITASHLPFNRNGFKFFTKAGGLDKKDISQILELASQYDDQEPQGEMTKFNFMPQYAQSLVETIRQKVNSPHNYLKPLEGLKIIVDAGNGAGGFFESLVLKELGADTSGSQFLEPDGNFPNHIPNPEDKKAMQSIISAVLEHEADFGIIFDTDVDRAGAVDHLGQAINRNRLIALLASILLEEEKGQCIVTDSVTSDELASFIEAKGGVHHRYKRGYKNVINEAIRLNQAGINCPLAIETSGHGAFRENYFLDDGAYITARLLIKLAQLKAEGKKINSLLSELAEPKEALEVRLDLLGENPSQEGMAVLERLEKFAQRQKNWTIAPQNYEGLRVSTNQAGGGGWFLLRLSLHDPIMPLNLESKEEGGIKKMLEDLLVFLAEEKALDTTKIKEQIASR